MKFNLVDNSGDKFAQLQRCFRYIYKVACGGREERYQGLGSHTVRFDLDAEEESTTGTICELPGDCGDYGDVCSGCISWRLTTIYFPRTTTWIWTTTMSMSSRMRTWWLLQRGRQGEATEDTVMKEEVEELGPFVYLKEFGRKLEMASYIDYDRMFVVPAVCPGGSKEEEIDVNFVYYKLVNGKWQLKTKGERNKEGTMEKWKFFMELNLEDAKDAWSRRKEILTKEYESKRQYPDEFLEKMTRESGIVMSTEEERRKTFNEYRQDELQLLGTIQPGGDELPDLEYTPTTLEDEVMEGTEQTGEVQRQTGEEGQRGEEREEEEEEHYPIPSDAGDSDDRGPFGGIYLEYLETGHHKRRWNWCLVQESNRRKHYVRSKNMTDKEEMSTWGMRRCLRLRLHQQVWKSLAFSRTWWMS